jgi:hypothetical protein
VASIGDLLRDFRTLAYEGADQKKSRAHTVPREYLQQAQGPGVVGTIVES